MTVTVLLTCDRCEDAIPATLLNANFHYPEAELPSGWIMYQRHRFDDIQHCCPTCVEAMGLPND